MSTPAPSGDPVLELARRLSRPRPVASAAGVNDRLMSALAADPGLRAAVFRLVDVAPACAGPEDLAHHLRGFLDEVDAPGRAAAAGSRVLGRPLGRRAAGMVAPHAIRRLAGRFIVGDSIGTAAPALRHLWERGSAVSVDLLGEATVTHAEGRVYAHRCAEALHILAREAARWPGRPHLERDSAGALPWANLSVKVSALTPLIRGEAPERAWDDAAGHLRRLMRRARSAGAHLHVDMESMESRDLVLGVLLEVLAEPEFRDGPSAGLVLQAYLRDSEEVLERILEWCRRTPRAFPLVVRLVKGAYWDHEMIQAAQNGWTPPVWTEKADSDRCFERLTVRLIEAFPLVRTAVASHNPRSVAHAVVHAREAGLAPGDLEVQVLRGLGDDLAGALRREGLRSRVYCPVGDMVAGMAYLVRRLLENTSNESFLVAGRTRGVERDRLLGAP